MPEHPATPPREPSRPSSDVPDGPTLADRVRRSPAVWAIGALNVVAYLLVEVRGGASTQAIVEAGALVVPLVPGEPWRLVTSTFLHFSTMHLLANMFGLAIFGPSFERLVGPVRFTALWLASGLAGSAAVVLLARGTVVAAGASGAVFGLLGALVVVGIRTRHSPAGRIRLRQTLVLLGINLAFGLVNTQVSLEAHAGGAVAGMAILAAYAPRPARPDRAPRSADPRRGLPVAVGIGALSVWLALTA